MIVINVDVAGNGRAGASSKCVEAGNEPHQFFRCQLFHGAAEETGRAGPWFVRQPLPTAGSWGQTCPPLLHGMDLPSCLQGEGSGKLEMVPDQALCSQSCG